MGNVYNLGSNMYEFENLRPNLASSKIEGKIGRRTNLNTSALLTSSKDFLNSTAPINMNLINKLYKEEAIILGFSDAVNST
jgi:hypothetical protein